ncbi:hypothetical protein [Solicola sp. PLA-1-18]|uniref:hypothetical protein n=1 Tax=Solicola sp. PLA-1-18 TaxID=3380532 RepID=UPI003B788104
MRRRPWISIEIEPGSAVAWVQGQNVKPLIEQAGGRPLWSATRRAWNTSADVGRDLLAVAEHAGYAVAFDQGGDYDDAA